MYKYIQTEERRMESPSNFSLDSILRWKNTKNMHLSMMVIFNFGNLFISTFFISFTSLVRPVSYGLLFKRRYSGASFTLKLWLFQGGFLANIAFVTLKHGSVLFLACGKHFVTLLYFIVGNRWQMFCKLFCQFEWLDGLGSIPS